MSFESTELISPAVEGENIGIRLDKFLATAFPDISRSRFQKLVLDGHVFLGTSRTKDSACRVKEGEIYKVIVPPPLEVDPISEDIPLNILYEDDDLLVVNKAAGMVVHPAEGAYSGTLVNALLHHCDGNLSGVGGIRRPGIVHRIDKETSGLLVVAKNDIAHRFLGKQFANHSIERTYYAFVYGNPNPAEDRIKTHIGRSPYDRKKMAVLQTGGKIAVTNYKTLKTFKRAAALVQCNLETGRTHQIRVHLSSMGNALIGDKVYTKSNKRVLGIPAYLRSSINFFPRQALHAKTLGFVHPRTKEFMQFDSELPQDLQELNQILNEI